MNVTTVYYQVYLTWRQWYLQIETMLLSSVFNGTNRSNNVTVKCRNVHDVVLGQIETLFTLVLEFVSKFSQFCCNQWSLSAKISGTLPPPNNVHHTSQGPGGRLQIMWQPPTLFTPQNVSVDSRIIHYVVSIISENIMILTPETSFSPELDNASCRFSFQVAAVNPAGEGEHSQLKIIDCESTIVTFLIFLGEIRIRQ